MFEILIFGLFFHLLQNESKVLKSERHAPLNEDAIERLCLDEATGRAVGTLDITLDVLERLAQSVAQMSIRSTGANIRRRDNLETDFGGRVDDHGRQRVKKQVDISQIGSPAQRIEQLP